MNQIFLKEFNTVHDDLMDRLIKENGIGKDKLEKEFSIVEEIKRIAKELDG
jgi:hypothetical protein